MALSDATGDPSYGEHSEGVIRMLMEAWAQTTHTHAHTRTHTGMHHK
jgi:hypothetical protein